MELDVPVVALGAMEAWSDLIKNAYWIDGNIESISRVTGREDVIHIKYLGDTVAPETLLAIRNLSADIAQSHERVPVEEVFRLGDCARRNDGFDATSALVERGIVR